MNLIRVFFEFFCINVKSILIYDLDYIFGIVAMLLKNTFKFSIILIIFNLIDALDGWTFYQVLFLYGFSLTAFALWHCFFINTISIPYMIQDGDFDRILLRPLSPIFQIMCDGFDEDGWGDLILGIIILIIAIFNLHIFSWYLLLLPVLLIASCLIYAGISISLSCIAFFTIGNSDFTDITMDIAEFSKYPLPIYGKVLQFVFTYIIPIGFASYYPSIFFIANNFKHSLALMFLTPIVSILFFLFSCKIWNYSLHYYSSTGH